MRDLTPLLSPRSIAIVGASHTGGRGTQTIKNLVEMGFSGPIYPVNPKYGSVLDITCYPTLSSLPETPDLMLLSIPSKGVLPLLEEAATCGIPAAVIYASGFSEAGDTGRALQTVPKVAIAPLIVVWFGFGIQSKIVIAAMVCFFPIVVNVIEGLQVTNTKQIELLRAMGASRWQIFRMIKVPNAAPFLFTGINVGIVMSVLGAIIGEFIGARSGLGYLILQYNFQIQMSKVFAVVLLLSLTGIGLHTIVKLIHRRVVFWVKPEDVVGL